MYRTDILPGYKLRFSIEFETNLDIGKQIEKALIRVMPRIIPIAKACLHNTTIKEHIKSVSYRLSQFGSSNLGLLPNQGNFNTPF